ncbi:VOC family protein [Ciceribacter sp. L1K22]|uniref:VOC family protein n=1 Tax=Ciceribacter sp. L1K22 TaxID=2820275 RepID=UPI001ABEDA53|nr:VOC family protein [Ciceribacter sp. L1K22]MBO3760237.1 VOC family protein [Ciceribacter sp. L1K22]
MTARAIDHLVLPVVSIEAARARHAALGFTVAADARHPFGTENACVFFADGTYLEPLGVASREECEAAAKAGNVFVARDQAFRFRCGEGLSGIAITTNDAVDDDVRYREAGLSAGAILEFSRPVRMPDGSESRASFRLTFAADLRAPDFFLFNCERIDPLPADRGSLTVHQNGATGIRSVVVVEENPSDFQYLFEAAFDSREIGANSFGIDLLAGGTRVEVMTPVGALAHYGLNAAGAERGLRGRAVVFACGDLGVTERGLVANGVAFERRGNRLSVHAAPGQGVTYIFEEQA